MRAVQKIYDVGTLTVESVKTIIVNFILKWFRIDVVFSIFEHLNFGRSLLSATKSRKLEISTWNTFAFSIFSIVANTLFPLLTMFVANFEYEGVIATVSFINEYLVSDIHDNLITACVFILVCKGMEVWDNTKQRLLSLQMSFLYLSVMKKDDKKKVKKHMKIGVIEKIEACFERIEEWGNQLRSIQKEQIEKESGISVDLTIEWAKAWVIQKLPKKHQLTAIQLLSE